MDPIMKIRPENKDDHDAISKNTIVAYEDYPFRQQTEHLIIDDLRKADALTVSLVAEVDGQVIGHMAVSPVTISDGASDWYGLGPISVLPEFQGLGIGGKLIKAGLSRLMNGIGGRGCVLVGPPNFYCMFGFTNYPQLIHEDSPQELFLALPFAGKVPCGTVKFHPAFMQLAEVEKDVVVDVIIDYAMAGVKMDLENPTVQRLIDKGILMEMPGHKVIMRPTVLEEYDPRLASLTQFRMTEMGRVHKNPFMAAIKS
ncbi:Predicted N-acetyltransferase YhbS [Desulfatibacillum alkenivorans DSM 16219]|jgi:predicted N-acetyltransferase YhbS|uniref:Predicted N-acetyltransferase YhbS n=2 Tax=Desulfatibacillum alkenivorans TaxID=259354 RepID=A0A1M6ZPM9_9BACT|nr:Predicted N-acetyltransferase YhbS [Desulfatibacillum alkenivorans DSM 16219]